MIDAHAHVHDVRSGRQAVRRAVLAGVFHVVSCACHEQDWAQLEASLNDAVVPCFGLHPWWAAQAPRDYLDKLRYKLEMHPKASLGEIGLCKSARGNQVPKDVQASVFSEQLELATTMRRTCVIHCVGQYGKLLQLMRSSLEKHRQLPPHIVLHSYGGAPDMTQQFLSMSKRTDTELYFSFNVKQLLQNGKAAESCIRVPEATLLLETDAPDQAPSETAVRDAIQVFGLADRIRVDEMQLSEGINEPALVQLALYKAAQLRHTPASQLCDVVVANAKRAYGISDEKEG